MVRSRTYDHRLIHYYIQLKNDLDTDKEYCREVKTATCVVDG